MRHGQLIVIYGVNNLGKTTQALRLVELLKNKGCNAHYLKYPLYDLEPTGPLLYDYLRRGNPNSLTSREFQLVQILNRTQYDITLRRRLKAGEWIVAEDYVGTGIAWGMQKDGDKDFLTALNSHLYVEDLALLFHGRRYLEATEQDHRHETDHDYTERVRLNHETLARLYGWHLIDANQPIASVTDRVWRVVSERLHP